MKTDAIHTVDSINLFEKWNVFGIIFDSLIHKSL